MRSITLKMVLAFLGIALISIVSIVLLARWNTGTEFSRFITDRHSAEMVEVLGGYYRANGSWDGVRRFIIANNSSQTPDSRALREPVFTLADENGQVVFAGPGVRPGAPIPPSELEHGLPIEVDGELVGTLVLGRFPFERNPREEEFIRRTNLMLVYSALGASLVAFLLGIFLSRTLTRPIRELTEATHAVAEGNLGLQVSVHSRDEMGELAKSFNKMSVDLARSSNARKQMTADIAHELRTPLSLILGHAEAVHDGVLPPSKENFEIIREEAIRLEHLVDDLRTLSLADAGELSINPQPISVQKLLEELQAAYQHRAAQQGVSIHSRVTSKSETITVDPLRMTQVLSNVVDNALQHTPAGGFIEISAQQIDTAFQIAIKDSGPGISGENVDHIFERFYRADESRNRDHGGSGLGLAIAKSIVQAHNGHIWAESTPGQGLTVRIQLP